METKKKKLSKKTVIIGSIILALVLFGMGYGLLYYYAYIWEPKEKEKFTFEEITQGLSEKVDHVEYEEISDTGDDFSDYDVFLSTTRYFAVKDPGTGELELKVLFYDENNEPLFYMQIYRYGSVLIKINEHVHYYHFCI